MWLCCLSEQVPVSGRWRHSKGHRLPPSPGSPASWAPPQHRLQLCQVTLSRSSSCFLVLQVEVCYARSQCLLMGFSYFVIIFFFLDFSLESDSQTFPCYCSLVRVKKKKVDFLDSVNGRRFWIIFQSDYFRIDLELPKGWFSYLMSGM